jgi:hypothetical protein
MLEKMMLPQYHLKLNDGAWSDEALEFLSLSLTGSAEMLRMVSVTADFSQRFVDVKQHPFLSRSLSSGKLMSRVRFTLEVLRKGTL